MYIFISICCSFFFFSSTHLAAPSVPSSFWELTNDASRTCLKKRKERKSIMVVEATAPEMTVPVRLARCWLKTSGTTKKKRNCRLLAAEFAQQLFSPSSSTRFWCPAGDQTSSEGESESVQKVAQGSSVVVGGGGRLAGGQGSVGVRRS